MTTRLLLAAALALGEPAGNANPDAGRHGGLPAASEAHHMEWNGAYCPKDAPSYTVIKTDKQWKALWKRLGKPAPPADLKAYFGVAVFLGEKPTGGWSVGFGQTPEGVRFEERAPRGMATMALTRPWAVKLFPRSAGEARAEAVTR